MKQYFFLFLLVFNTPFIKAQVNDTDLYLGISAGTWFATGGNRALGNPVLLGVNADLKFEKHFFGLHLDYMIFPKTKQPIYLEHEGEVIEKNNASGAQGTLEYGTQILAGTHYVFTAGAALGYGNIIYYNPDENTDISKDAVIIAPTLAVWYMRKKTYYQFKLQYNIANYDHSAVQNVSLNGNALMLKFIIGMGWR
jgi:hypothetical protein